METDIQTVTYPYAEIDAQVKAVFFPDDPDCRYAFDRRAAARVVEQIVFHPDKAVRRRFNETLKDWYDERRDVGIERGLDLFLLWATPDVICQAALDAVQCTPIPKT